MALVVSLSTIPTRFDKLEPVLLALVHQAASIDEIRLYVPKHYRRFPDYDGTLPTVPKGIRVIQPEDDLGPATKVLFAAQDLRGEDCDIIYCDDDRVYPKTWFARLLQQRAGRLDHCVAASTIQLDRFGFALTKPRQPRPRIQAFNPERTWALLRRKVKQFTAGANIRKPGRNRFVVKSGYAEIAEGCGGVLVRPDFFDDTAFDIPPVLWSVDDFWLSGQMARRNVPILAASRFRTAPLADHTTVDALYDTVLDGAGRHEANSACVDYMRKTYGIWL